MDSARKYHFDSSSAKLDKGERVNMGYEAEGKIEEMREEDDGKKELGEKEEEKILQQLREVVKKCTCQDPYQRPTAEQVLAMIKKMHVQ